MGPAERPAPCAPDESALRGHRSERCAPTP